MLPYDEVYGDIVIVSTPTKNYTTRDYQQLFIDANFTSQTQQLYQDITPYRSLQAPG